MMHNVSPYCLNGDTVYSQLNKKANNNHHRHEHHAHNSSQEFNHEHIKHKNHLDENYFDLFVCVLNDVEIPSDDCDLNCFVLWNQKDSQLNINNLKLIVSVIISMTTEINIENTIQNISVQNDDVYSSPALEYSPLRGPPIFSC